MPKDIQTTLDEFLSLPTAQLTRLHTVQHQVGSPESFVRDFYQFLQQKGFKPRLCLLRGFRKHLQDAHPVVRSLEPKDVVQIVIRVGNKIVDLTGAQFGTHYGRQVLWRIGDLKQYWRKIRDVTDQFEKISKTPKPEV